MNNFLARFALERGKIKEKAGEIIVDPRLFEPNSQLLLSTARIEDLTCAEIKEVGINVARKHKTAKHLYGWAQFSRNVINEIGLEIDDDPPPSRHSDIKGWPKEKEKRVSMRRELALKSKPVLLEEKIPINKTEALD